MKKEDFKLLQTMIPEQPGIYKFLDAKGEIIYVGKAKPAQKDHLLFYGFKRP